MSDTPDLADIDEQPRARRRWSARRFLSDDTPRDPHPNYQPLANASVPFPVQTRYLVTKTHTAENGAVVTVTLPPEEWRELHFESILDRNAETLGIGPLFD